MPITVKTVLSQIVPVKRMTRETVYEHMRRNGIKPVGKRRQCPQLYPDDTAARILKPLGLSLKRNGLKRNHQP